MPDASRPPSAAPRDWAEAFAALPLEAPAGDAWAQIAARIGPASQAQPARRLRRRPLWLAVAAAAALAVALPLLRQPAPGAGPQPVVALHPSPSPPAAQAPNSAAHRTTAAQRDPVPGGTKTAPAGPSAVAGNRPDLGPASGLRTGAARASRASAAASDTRLARRPAKRTDRETHPATADIQDEAALAVLQAQSAQLESLLAMARDERVASGTAAALSNELDTRVGLIDAALIQPGLAPRRRIELWRLRVDALQQLAGIEATQRLYAARGQRYAAVLVSLD